MVSEVTLTNSTFFQSYTRYLTLKNKALENIRIRLFESINIICVLKLVIA